MQKAAKKSTDNARISIRTNSDFRQTISYAAELSGLDLTNFMVSAALRQARDVIREHEVIRIASVEDRAAFRAALCEPGRHIPALAELLKIPPVLNAAER